MFELELELVEILIPTIVICIFECSMFTKMGVSGGFAFVPIYKDWIISTKTSESKKYFVVSCLFNAVMIAFIIDAFKMLSKAAKGTLTSSDMEAGYLGIYILFLVVLAILAIIRSYIYSNDVADAFGRNDGFKAGLFFLHPVFVAILAYGPAEYIGPDGYSPDSFVYPTRDEDDHYGSYGGNFRR